MPAVRTSSVQDSGLASLPVVIIGAGPIGLAAAANAQARGMSAVVLEAGPAAGASVSAWAHVRLFSPWSELIDPTAEKLLAPTGWVAPDQGAYPTGGDWVADYLTPLASALDATDEVQVRFDARVVGVGRASRDLMVDSGRADDAFAVHVDGPTGRERLLARAVVDASGTWTKPNPLGADGYPALGEPEAAGRITYGIPDFTDPEVGARFAGKHVAVAGKGASAQNVLVGLGELAAQHPSTKVSWLLRRPAVGDAFGGGDNDQLEQRGKLGEDARAAASSGLVTTLTRFRTGSVGTQADGRLVLASVDGQRIGDVDEVIVVTGFRPDFTFLSEVRLDLDPALGAVRVLADQIRPDLHSCGDVAPHGHRELTQPDPNVYLVGMKSYGRAPSFLAMTGFEQVRSVVAAIDGDLEAADRVELVLPETGVCGGSGLFDGAPASSTEAGGCCGTAPVLSGVTAPALVTIGAAPSSETANRAGEAAGGCGPTSCG